MRARLALIALLVALTACADREADAGKPLMQVVSFDGWRAALASYRPSVVVVDLWASWCTTCIERFPEMVRLAREYDSRNVRFLSLNLDDHTDGEALQWAENFLREQGGPIDHYHLGENMMVAFETLNLLGIPAVLIYDDKGRERYRLTGDDPANQFDESDVEQALQALLVDT